MADSASVVRKGSIHRMACAGVTLVLVGMLTQPPALAHELDGVLGGSITREAARLANDATGKDDAAWQRVRSLQAGTQVVVLIRGAASRQRRFVSADARC